MKKTINIILLLTFCAQSWAQNVYESVDLGLSVLWASCNVGADAPEKYGSYFAWGETATKSIYTESNYTLKNGSTMMKFTNDISGSEYDAAAVLWKSGWRMPTIAEIDELATKCTWTWTSMNGVNGYRIVGPSGRYIFLPAAGQMRDRAINVGSTGYYWSATPSAEYVTAAYNLNFTGYDGRWSANRYYGFAIRPVKAKGGTLKGDLNEDGKVDAADVTELINIILGKK